MPTNFFFTTPLLLLFMDPGSGMGKNHDPGSSTLLGGMQILGRPTPPPPPPDVDPDPHQGFELDPDLDPHQNNPDPQPWDVYPGSDFFPSRIRTVPVPDPQHCFFHTLFLSQTSFHFIPFSMEPPKHGLLRILKAVLLIKNTMMRTRSGSVFCFILIRIRI
jgi:hypothetical protein